jgi:HK97 family phage major capsid protein/HK97 family phage prohead protease
MDRLEIKAEIQIDDTGTVTGLAWPFGVPDQVGDVIERGAFSFPSALPIVIEHDQNNVVGVWENLTETDTGLEVKGRLFVEGIKPAREARTRLQTNQMKGLSIGFRWDECEPLPSGGRRFKSVHITEISLCRRPVHPGARVTAIKSMNKEPQMENEELTPTIETKADPVIDQKTLDAMKTRLDKLEAKSNRPIAANNNQPNAVNDNGHEERKAFGDYLRTGRLEEKALSFGAPSTGGILAPEEVSRTVLEKVAEFSPIRQLASSISMSGPLLQLPRLVDEVQPTSVSETGTRSESEPTFEQIDLKPFEMAVIVPVTRILLEDAQIDLASYLEAHISRRFGQIEASWFVTGNGLTQAEGVLTADEVREKEFAAIDGDALIDTFYDIASAYAANGSWMMNRHTMAIVRKLKDTDGSYLWQPSIAAGVPPTLLGRPVYEGVDMPNVAAGSTPIVFGDFATGYTIADRVGITTVRDELTGAGNGIIKLHVRRRVGGRVVMGEALTKLKIAA